MLRMVAYSRRLKSGQITCYLNRTYHVLLTPEKIALDHWLLVLHNPNSNGANGMESAITVKGQATIPKPVRKHLGLKPGDRIKFFLQSDGTVVILPKLPASALRGILKSRTKRRLTIEQMDEAISQGFSGGRRKPR
jgi:AbrB family looped-hinge helix DNA binding protein